ncbi:putative RNA-directed DNA polymerase [Helianthus annuus]|nr:putative RNA-directed DNA polymerase [Helianthus annuus]
MKTINVYEPPKLVRNEFTMWKQRMKDFLNIFDAALWSSIRDGPHVPKMNLTHDENMKRIDFDEKAHAILAMALSDDIYRGLLHCKSAKELWDSICGEYEESPDVLANRAQLLIQQYEMFGYVCGESMTQQFERFVSLVSELKFRGVIYDNECLVNKFMRSLPDRWSTYTMVIRESKDLTKMTLTQLHGLLETYELELNKDKKISQGSTQVDDDTPSPQTFILFEENLLFEDLEQFHPDDLEEMDLKYQMAMLNLRRKRFIERTGRDIVGNLTSEYIKSRATCCKCQKIGHFARECKSPVAKPR